MIAPLRRILELSTHAKAAHLSGLVCPGRKPGGRNSGLLSTSALYTRADEAWQAHKLEPIRLQDCRHTASSWMRAAGIDLKIRSVLMGHASTASTDRGPGSITDDRYTHLLPGEIEEAGKQFAAYLTAQVKKRRKLCRGSGLRDPIGDWGGVRPSAEREAQEGRTTTVGLPASASLLF